MPTYSVVVRRSIECTVDVEAASPEDAVELVSRADYRLPPRDEWDGIKDWAYFVYDDGEEVYERY